MHHASGSGVWAKIKKRLGFYRDWKAALRRMENGSLLLLQFPFHDLYYFYDRYLLEAKRRGIRLVYMVHDVERLRGSFNSPRHERELEFMRNNADAVIVHNAAMRRYFSDELQMAPEKIITLGIFDYLCGDGKAGGAEAAVGENTAEKGRLPWFAGALYIAGNLDAEKTGYLRSLPELKDLHFELYGINCPETLKRAENIHYNGAAAPEELPGLLRNGFGLVWDGNSIDTCSGLYGEYLRYNSPHKLSLYLAAGIPVVIWEKAAQAEYVRAHGVGITVSSLKEAAGKLEEARERYPEMAAAALALSEKLRAGYYTRQALVKAEETVWPKC